MGAQKKVAIPLLMINKSDDLPTIYTKARQAFSAADLQKYTEVEVGIPLEDVIAEMESVQQKRPLKRKKKKA